MITIETMKKLNYNKLNIVNIMIRFELANKYKYFFGFPNVFTLTIKLALHDDTFKLLFITYIHLLLVIQM